VRTQNEETSTHNIESPRLNTEDEFRSLFELSAVGAAQVSPEGRYVRVNQKYCQMLGYSEHELLQRTVLDVTHPDDREASAVGLSSSFTAGEPEEYSIEKRYIRKDGGIVWALVKWRVLCDENGKPIHTVANAEDITGRKQAEDALRAREAQLRAIIDNSSAFIFVKDLEGRYLKVNRGYELVRGMTEAEMKGKTDYDLYPKDIADGVHKNDEEVIAANKPIQFEETVPFSDGFHHFVSVKFPLSGDDGKPYAVCGISTDITDRQKVEQALQAADERLKLAMEAGEIGTFDWNIRTNEVFWSEPSMATFGTPSGASQGVYHDWAKRLHPGDLQVIEERLQEVLKKKGRHWLAEYRLADDGTTRQRWVRSQGHIVYDFQGEPVRMIGANIDISDRRQAEAERETLLAREQVARAETEHAAERIRRLQAVTDSALGHFVMKDFLLETLARVRELIEVDAATILLPTEDGRSLVVRAVAGYDGGIIGRSVPIGEGLAGTIAANRAPLIVEDLSQSKVMNPILRERVRSLIGAPMLVEGRLVGVIHADSFTARHFNDSDLRLLQLAADRIALAIEQARLYEVEQQARRQAEEANRMKDEFLALVSHELRSPLNAMLGYARLLRYGPLDEQKVSKTVDVIERSGKAQIQLIEDLLDTARIISGKLHLDVGPVDLASVIDGAVQTIYPAADGRHIAIQTDLDPNVGQITGDTERLQQVIWNLLSNSVKFTPRGGRIDIRLERIDPHICVTVSDTGKGIHSDFLPYVFDRFRQADSSSTRRYGGLGLGLALVKYLVELHGGTVEAFSAGESKGTTFTVLLPVRAVFSPLEGEGVPVSSLRLQKSTLAGVRALVVDDEEDARELVKTVLAQHGADVVAACSAAEAFALMTAPCNKPPDVIVSDLGMPDEDGYSLLRRVRHWERAHHVYTPAVALTAYGRSEDRMRALMAGFQMHVAKPVEPGELAIVVASVLSRR
jgi:PAS domain S-box-containing protein